LLLVVTAPEVVAASSESVRLSFAQLTLDWQEYESMRPRAPTWTAGHLDLIAQPAGGPYLLNERSSRWLRSTGHQPGVDRLG